jgi:hypothetical protein
MIVLVLLFEKENDIKNFCLSTGFKTHTYTYNLSQISQRLANNKTRKKNEKSGYIVRKEMNITKRM